eukprot:15468859-Alexandrium_andersonii.AAC.1
MRCEIPSEDWVTAARMGARDVPVLHPGTTRAGGREEEHITGTAKELENNPNGTGSCEIVLFGNILDFV